MRLLMTSARVTTSSDGSPVAVAWAPSGSWRYLGGRQDSVRAAPGSRPVHGPRDHVAHTRRVLAVIDRWRYDGRWWEGEGLHRDYLFVELEGGVRAELYREGGDWWVARISD